MISVNTCKEIFKCDNIILTDDDAERILTFLYTLAEVRVEKFLNQKMRVTSDNNVIYLNENKTKEL